MKLKFKLIPFLLSLLIVFGVTFGICWYSYHDYPINKYTFYEEYFHMDDHEDYETTELIENALKFQFDEYIKASNTVALHDSNETVSYKDGTIHVDGYFDIDVYITNSINEGESVYSYYFYFYNVNYKASTFDPAERIQIVVAQGTGEGTSENEDDELFGDALLDRELEELFDEDEDNNPKYSGLYPFSWTNGTNHYPVFDNGYENDENNPDITEHYVYRGTPRQSHDKKEVFNDDVPEDGTITFAIVKTFENDSTRYEELVRGSITEIDKLSELEYNEGHGEDVYSTNYSKVVGTRVAIHGAIAFAISAVIAFLFYMLWMDPKDNTPKKKQLNKKGNKK